ncbi:MAG: class I SAM-dependent methyltransferase [Planctomycetes bacterium]|nr:class I SAM-dependent methyltransferase [Planctomycetota bacterium]MCC7169933.1 class I SAM-dependent methyltransferase [Planctomycetota bacterium]
MDPSEYRRIFEHEDDHFWYRALHRLARRELERFRPRTTGRVLDAGCGTGGFLARVGGKTVGIDFSPIALAFASRRGLERLARADMTRLPFTDGTFDAVMSLDVLYHRAVADDAAALGECARVLVPGGIVVLNVPAHPELRGAHDAIIHTARRYSRDGVLALARSTGLDVVRVTGFNALLYPVAVTVRRLRRGGPPRSDVEAVHPIVGSALSAVLAIETGLNRWFDWPFGLSLFAVFRKPRALAAPQDVG